MWIWIDSQPAPPISQRPSEPSVSSLNNFVCIRGVLQLENVHYSYYLLTTSMLPYGGILVPLSLIPSSFTQTKHCWKAVNHKKDCIPMPRPWPVLPLVKRDQSLRWSSWGYKNHTCSLQDCHGPWPYRGSWPQKCKQEFPAMVDTSNSNL